MHSTLRFLAFYLLILSQITHIRAQLPLEFVGIVATEGVDGVSGLVEPTAFATTSDGAYVYVGTFDNPNSSIVVFRRDTTTGALTYVQTFTNGDSGTTGLFIVRGLTVSPDDRHLYAGGNGNSLITFSIDAGTGMLTFVEELVDSIPTDGLGGIVGFVFDDSGEHLYILGYTDDSVSLYVRDLVSGTMTYTQKLTNLIDAGTNMDFPDRIIISFDNLFVYVSSSTDSAISIFSRNALTGILTYSGVAKQGIGGISGFSEVDGMTVSSDGLTFYATTIIGNGIITLDRDTTTGLISERTIDIIPISAVNVVISLSQDETRLYGISVVDNIIFSYSRDTTTGTLTFVNVLTTMDMGLSTFIAPYEIMIDPTGNTSQIYVSSFDATDHEIFMFAQASPSASVTPTPSPSPSVSFTPAATPTLTPTPSVSPTASASITQSATPSASIAPISLTDYTVESVEVVRSAAECEDAKIELVSTHSSSLELGQVTIVEGAECDKLIQVGAPDEATLAIILTSSNDDERVSAIVDINIFDDGDAKQPERPIQVCLWINKDVYRENLGNDDVQLTLSFFSEKRNEWEPVDDNLDKRDSRASKLPGRGGEKEVLLCGHTPHLTNFAIIFGPSPAAKTQVARKGNSVGEGSEDDGNVNNTDVVDEQPAKLDWIFYTSVSCMGTFALIVTAICVVYHRMRSRKRSNARHDVRERLKKAHSQTSMSNQLRASGGARV